jgi:hypothetical protein
MAAHEAQPPVSLRARLDGVLAASPRVGDVHAQLLDSGCDMLRDLLAAGRTDRDAALDLLTADALVTYAFEAAADAPDVLDGRAAAAMRAISMVAESSGR